MIPASATKIDETLELINKLDLRGSAPSDFDFARLEKLIKQIEKIDKAASLSFRETFYRLKCDYTQAEYWHEAALQEAPSSPSVYRNFAVTLSREGKYNQAVEVLLKGFSNTDVILESLRDLLADAFMAERVDVIKTWLPKYNSLTGESLTPDQLEKLVGFGVSDISADECYAASCALGCLDDWDSPEEDEAWRHL